MSVKAGKTDAQLAELDVAGLLRVGLGDTGRSELFGDGAVAAAIQLERDGVVPASLTFLAEIVRAGGTGYAAELPEPLPIASQTEIIRPWLVEAAKTTADEPFARWLEAVAAIIELRLRNRP